VYESVLRLVKSCVLRPLDRRQASGHTLRCVRYEPTVIYIDMRHAIITDLASLDLARTVRFCKFMHACMLVSPARRRSGLDSTGRGVAPAARVTYSFLSFLGTVSYRIRILMYLDVSCMYLDCILMCPVKIHQDTSRYICILLSLAL